MKKLLSAIVLLSMALSVLFTACGGGNAYGEKGKYDVQVPQSVLDSLDKDIKFYSKAENTTGGNVESGASTENAKVSDIYMMYVPNPDKLMKSESIDDIFKTYACVVELAKDGAPAILMEYREKSPDKWVCERIYKVNKNINNNYGEVREALKKEDKTPTNIIYSARSVSYMVGYDKSGTKLLRKIPYSGEPKTKDISDDRLRYECQIMRAYDDEHPAPQGSNGGIMKFSDVPKNFIDASTIKKPMEYVEK